MKAFFDSLNGCTQVRTAKYYEQLATDQLRSRGIVFNGGTPPPTLILVLVLMQCGSVYEIMGANDAAIVAEIAQRVREAWIARARATTEQNGQLFWALNLGAAGQTPF